MAGKMITELIAACKKDRESKKEGNNNFQAPGKVLVTMRDASGKAFIIQVDPSNVSMPTPTAEFAGIASDSISDADALALSIDQVKYGGLSDASHIPAGFQSFQQIPVPFQWNLPAKISLLLQNFDIPVISPEQSPELTRTEWHWNPVTRMNTKNCQIWYIL